MRKTRAKPKAQVVVSINDDAWTCRLWRAKTYERIHGTDSGAITIEAERIMDFHDTHFSEINVAHELFHAYFNYLHLESISEPKLDDIEEVLASWIAANLHKFSNKVGEVMLGLTPAKKEETL